MTDQNPNPERGEIDRRLELIAQVVAAIRSYTMEGGDLHGLCQAIPNLFSYIAAVAEGVTRPELVAKAPRRSLLEASAGMQDGSQQLVIDDSPLSIVTGLGVGNAYETAMIRPSELTDFQIEQLFPSEIRDNFCAMFGVWRGVDPPPTNVTLFEGDPTGGE